MATLQEIGNWILTNQDKKGTPDFETVANAYRQLRAKSFEGLQKERQTKEQTFQDELRALRESARTPVTPVEKPPEDKVTVADQFEEFLKGIPGGAAGFAESAALGVTAPEDIVGSDVLRSGVKAVGDVGDKVFGADPGSEEIFGRKLGETIGSFGAGIAVTLLNPLLGIGAFTAAGAGEARERAKQADATKGQTLGATILGAGVGAAETFAPLRFVKRFKQARGAKEVMNIRTRGKRILESAGEEALQEYTAAVAQNLIEKGIYNPEQGAFEGAAEQAGYGGGVGGLAQGIFDMIAPRSRGADKAIQGELFEGEDLGQAPVTDTPKDDTKQGDLFEGEDLGETPVTEQPKTDTKQEELFDFDEEGKATPKKQPKVKTEEKLPEQQELFDDAVPKPREITQDLSPEGQLELADPENLARAGVVDKITKEAPIATVTSGEELNSVVGNLKQEVKTSKQEDTSKNTNAFEIDKDVFSPSTEPQLVDNRNKPDPKENFQNVDISGGNKEGTITSPVKLKAEFDKINYEPEISLTPTDVLTKNLLSTYKDALPNIKIFSDVAPWTGAHMDGGVAIQHDIATAGNTDLIAYIMAHELGHASHSLLGDKVNKNKNIKKEIKDIENVLYPDLRERIIQAEAEGKNVDTTLYNYLLSPEELIAQFNALRVASPETADMLAPTLSKLLKSVEKNKNLVKPRDVFRGYTNHKVSGNFDAELNPIIDFESFKGNKGKTPFDVARNKYYKEFRKTDDLNKKQEIYNDFLKGSWYDSLAKKDMGDVPTPVTETVPQPVKRKITRKKKLSEDIKEKVKVIRQRKKVVTEADKAKAKIKEGKVISKPDRKPTKPQVKAEKRKELTRAKVEGQKLKERLRDDNKLVLKEQIAKRIREIKYFKKRVATFKDLQDITPRSKKPEGTSLQDFRKAMPSFEAGDFLDTSDLKKIVELIRSDFTTTEFSQASSKTGRGVKSPRSMARMYFSKNEDPNETVNHIVYDTLNSLVSKDREVYSKDKDSTEGEIAYFSFTGGENAQLAFQWLEANLSKKGLDSIAELGEIHNVNSERNTGKRYKERVRHVKFDAKVGKRQEKQDAAEAYGVEVKDVTKFMLKNYRASSQSKAIQTGMQKARFIAMTPAQKAVYNKRVKEQEKQIAKDKEIAERKAKQIREDKEIQDIVDEIMSSKKARTETKNTEKLRKALFNDSETLTVADGEVYRVDPVESPRTELDLGKTAEKNSGYRFLYADEVASLDFPMHPMIEKLLRQSNLEGALRVMQITAPTKRLRQIAKGLQQVVGTTKVRFVSDHKDASGRAAAGSFDPKTNTIRLDRDTGINFHTIIHEAVHAATLETLADKNNPSTKEITKLFNEVKDSLHTADGARNVEEFVSEALSNVRFQQNLGQLNVKGEPFTVLQRFKNAIANLVRRLLRMETKGLESTLNKTDEVIMGMLSPAPSKRDAGEVFSLHETGKNIQGLVDSSLKNIPVYSKEIGNRIKDRLSDNLVPDAGKSAILGLLPLNALADIAKGIVPGAKDLERLLYEQAGSVAKARAKMEPAIKRISAWGMANPKLQEDFNNVIYESTLEQVDPSKNRNVYLKNKEKLKIYDKMHKNEWKRIGKEGRDHFQTMRNLYKSQYNEIERVLKTRIKETIDPTKSKTTVFDEMYKKLFESGVIDPYFPLTRSGKYWLSYNAIDGRTGKRELFVEAYESKPERNKAIREINDTPELEATDVEPFANVNEITYKNAPDASFVNEILTLAKAGNVPVEIQDQIMRLYLNALPERSFAQSMRVRKGTLGFKRDAIGALETKTNEISRQLAQIEFGYKIQKVRGEMKTQVRNKSDNELAVLYQKELDQRAQFGMNPDVQNWAKFGTSMGFMMTLGFNVSSAFVNLSQLPMVVFPYLGGKYGYTKTMKAMGNASKVFAFSGRKRKQESIGPNGDIVETVGALQSLDNYDFDAVNTPAEIKRYKELAEVAGNFGQLNRSITYDMLDVHDNSKSKFQKFNMFSGFIFHHAERFNRQNVLIAAYDLELDSLKAQGKTIDKAARIKAAEDAIYITELTNSGAIATMAPRFAQRGVGKIAFLFKRYGISMYYMLAKLTKNTFKGEERAVAARQLAGIFGMSGLIAGVHGLPLFGELAQIHDMLFEDEDEDDFETSVRKTIGEPFYNGVFNYAFGVDAASRMGLSNLVFREPLIKKDQPSLYTGIEMLGGPVVGTYLNMNRGVNLLSDGELYRGTEAMLPAAFRNVLKSYRFATEGANTLNGDPIVENIGPFHYAAQAMGFAPAEYTRNLQFNQHFQKIQKYERETKTNLYRKYYRALMEGDRDMNKLFKEILEYNRRFPQSAITPDGIMRSLRAKAQSKARMHNGMVINPRLRAELYEDAAEWGSTSTIWEDIGLAFTD